MSAPRNGKPAAQYWDVVRCDPVAGVGERIDRFQAVTRVEADRVARAKHGAAILVTLSTNAKRQQPRRRALDIGNMTRTTRRKR